jgi:hypothetical protein
MTNQGSEFVELDDGRIMVAWIQRETPSSTSFTPNYRLMNADGTPAEGGVVLQDLSITPPNNGTGPWHLGLTKLNNGDVWLGNATKATIISFPGSAKAIAGTSGVDNLVGGDGADTLTGGGGADKIYAGAGDDEVVLNDSNVTALGSTGAVVDGGSGLNTIRIDTSAAANITLDLTNVTLDNNISNVQKFDITGNGANTITLNVSDVLSSNMTAAMAGVTGNTTATNAIQIDGGADDIVNLSSLLDSGTSGGTWSTSSTATIGNTTYNLYSLSNDPSVQVLIDNQITQVTLS